jgi:hypothetical protein
MAVSDAHRAGILTFHALLVMWGQFAQHIGLIEAIDKVACSQKTYRHRPQTKILEFFLATLAGLAHLKDLSHAAHPIDQDMVVAAAWRQPAWADASGVSRTLQAMTAQEGQHVAAVFGKISQPFVDREVMLALQQSGGLVYDFDLTGRPVSNTSTTYPGVAFGYLSDAVHLGYQAALVTMHSPTYGRLWLSVAHHPGDTHSFTQVDAMIRAAEERTGVRPLRRTSLLRASLAALASEMKHKVTGQVLHQGVIARRASDLATAQRCVQEQDHLVAMLQTAYEQSGRLERPYSALSHARDQLAVLQRRLVRREKAVRQSQHQKERHERVLTSLHATHVALQERLTRFERDNAGNANPVRAEIRLDAGFGTGDSIALLIEMGYDVYTKPCSSSVTAWLKQRVSPDMPWVTVGANAVMTCWEPMTIGGCPYLLNVALERFHTGETEKYSTLFHYGDCPVRSDLPRWFHRYNGRQTIEAGIKEGKQVFQMHHLKVRSAPAIELQEHCAVFAANFVRWAAAWLTTSCTQHAPDDHAAQPTGIKQMVQVGAHTSARVTWLAHGCVLHFTKQSVFAGQTMEGHAWALQLALPTFKTRDF